MRLALRHTARGTGPGTWGNPTAVVDGTTVYLFTSWNAGDRSAGGGDPLPDGTRTLPIDSTWEGRRHLYLTKSTDDGETWSAPQDLTTTLIPAGWAWDAVGPGIGVKLGTGEPAVPAKGRNLIGRGTTGNRTWTMQTLGGSNNEGTIAQTPDGRLYRNDRPNSGDYRRVARGTLASFGAFANDTGLKIGALVETDFFEYGSDPRSHRAIVWRRFNLSWILNGPNA